MHSGKWEVPRGCVKKECAQNIAVENGNASYTQGFTYLDHADVACSPGYKINGTTENNNVTESLQCMATGFWQLPRGCVKKECTTDISVINGNVSYINGTAYLDHAQVTCFPGYMISGTGDNNKVSESVQCQHTGSWDMPRVCVKKECAQDIAVLNGNVSYTHGYTYLDYADVTCSTGYKINGTTDNNNVTESLQCMATGFWQLPRGCVKKECTTDISIKNGNVSYTNGTAYLDYAIVTCSAGYRINGTGNNNNVSESLQCLHTGRWEIQRGCVEKECTMEIPVINGNILYTNGNEYHDYAHVRCSPGYKINGTGDNNQVSESVQCQHTGRWEIPRGCVKKDCCTPNKRNLTTVHAPYTTFNASAVYTCIHGYNTTNTTLITCMSDGQWSGDAPICSDIDECLNRRTCHYNANCTNTKGSFKCQCQLGYRDLDGVGGQRCVDLDKCEFGGEFYCKHAFNQTKVCVNIDGGYVCVCNQGFTGISCDTDVLECEANTTCGAHAICSNTYGGYSCTCEEGYPQGNPYLGCFKRVLLDFKAPGDRYNGDDTMIDAYHISTRLPYFGQYIHWFKPSMDGFISLDFQPLYNQYGGENTSEWKAAVQNHKVIAPLWTNIDSTNITDGGLWIHAFTDRQNNTIDIEKIQYLVRQYTNQIEFNVSVAMVATWRHVTVHSPYEPGYELVKHQNISMQCILVSDGMYTYIMFNYDQEQFSIRPLPEVPVASGYTNLDYTGVIMSDRYNFSLLNQDSNVQPGFPGRWMYNVTVITESMRNEILCQTFYEDNKVQLKIWLQTQLIYALPCPCQEVLMMEDYTFTRNDSLRPGFGSHVTCYESWFFSAYGIKQRCCYMFSKLETQYPGAVAAEFENNTIASLLQNGYDRCCSPDGSQKYCPLYAEINPPDDCSRYTIN